MISIRFPIWKTRSVGIATHKIGMDKTTIEILYADKTGKRIYPNTYSIDTPKLKQYPIQAVQGGVKLYIVPIADLTIEQYGQ